MIDYDKIQKAKEVIFQSNDDGNRLTNKSAKAIFDEFKSIVDQENIDAMTQDGSYLKKFNQLIKSKESKKLSKDIKKTEKNLLAVFGSIDIGDINKMILKGDFKIKEWENLNKKNLKTENYEDILYKIAKRLYNKNIVVHGEKQKNGGLKQKSDIDADASILLLKLCHFFKDDNSELISPNIRFVENGKGLDEGLHLDTNQTINGMKIESKKILKENKKGENVYNTTLFRSALTFDEHGDGSDMADKIKRPTSTTHMVYTLLKSLGKVKEGYELQMERFVDFVDIVDSKYYAIAGADFDNLHRTIFGLHRDLDISYIYKYFSDQKNTGFEVLSDEFLDNPSNNVKFGENKFKSLKSISDYKKKSLEKAEEKFKDTIDKPGRYLEYKGNDFTIDIGAKIPYCPIVSERYDHGCFRLFDTGDVYIYNSNGLPEEIGGYKTNSPFLLKNMTRDEFNKFLSNFEFNKRIQGKEEILKEIDNVFFNLENKNILLKDKIEKNEKEALEFDKQKLELENIDELVVGDEYTGVIESISNNQVNVWIDPDKKGIIHKRQIGEDLFKKIFKGDNIPVKGESIKVKLIDLSRGDKSLQFSIDYT